MTATPPPVLDIKDVSKQYSGLRPLRLAALTLAAGERVSISGMDAGVAELLVNLVTGASVPDSGEIRVFGTLTSEIPDGDAWLILLERFGIVSPRAVLLEGATLEQNLAMPFTLAIDPIPPDIASQIRQLSIRCGIDPDRWLGVIAGALPADIRVRAHMARSLALAPELVIVEHPTADVDASAVQALGEDLVRACDGVSALVLTNDETFAKIVAPRNLRLVGATGALTPLGGGSWFTW
jgi:ABC-type lipoprotein export system ATPase subunit